MVNHARTLLINKLPNQVNNEALGAIYIDPTFVPVQELDSVIKAKSILFGTDPDQLTSNFRAAEYMNLLRASSYSYDYIKSLDSRLTDEYKHWPDFPIGASFVNLVIGNLDFNLIDKYIGDDFTGRNIGKVKLTFYESDLNMCGVHNYIDGTYSVVNYDVSSITQFSIPGLSDLKAQIFNLSDIMDSPEVVITAYAYPSRSLLDIARTLIAMGAHNYDFQLPQEQPYIGFLDQARSAVSSVDKLIGILLCVIASNEQQRIKG